MARALLKYSDIDSSRLRLTDDEESDDDVSPLVLHKRNVSKTQIFRDNHLAVKVNGNLKFGSTPSGVNFYQSSSLSTNFFLFILVCLILGVIFIYQIYNGTSIKSFLTATIFGCGMTIFTWMITYFDSKRPGISPPTPMSPRKIREKSGHTFHFNYIMAIMNGAICFLLAIYNQLGATIHTEK